MNLKFKRSGRSENVASAGRKFIKHPIECVFDFELISKCNPFYHFQIAELEQRRKNTWASKTNKFERHIPFKMICCLYKYNLSSRAHETMTKCHLLIMNNSYFCFENLCFSTWDDNHGINICWFCNRKDCFVAKWISWLLKRVNFCYF